MVRIVGIGVDIQKSVPYFSLVFDNFETIICKRYISILQWLSRTS